MLWFGDLYLFHKNAQLSGILYWVINMNYVYSLLVNTEAAEILYGTIGEWCGVSSNTVLLDICCGTGTIGLTMAKVIIGLKISKL